MRVRALAGAILLAGCSTPAPPPAAVASHPSVKAHQPAPAPGTTPPAWLGRRVLPRTSSGFGQVRPTPPELRNRRFTLPDTLPPPGDGRFHSTISGVPKAVLARSTWRSGCPVTPDQLRYVTVSFWGFDARPHTGELLVNRAVAQDITGVFRRLFTDRYPLEALRITSKADESAPPTGDGNTSGAFDCRPVRGSKVTSQHAYGLAVDLNPFQNPFVGRGVVLPELASSYLKRDRRPGILHGGDPAVRAFKAIGWGWGGDWHSLKDHQHFSRNGR